MKAAIYSRVSTHDKGQDLTLQSDELKAYCQRQDWEVVEYQDETSGAKASRPGLDRLIQDARLHRLDVLVVWKLDRLFRSMIDCVTTLDNLSRWGVRFVSLQDGLEIDPVAQSPLQRFQMQLFASLAELERGMIRERVQGDGSCEVKRHGIRSAEERDRRRPGQGASQARGVVVGGIETAGANSRDVQACIGAIRAGSGAVAVSEC